MNFFVGKFFSPLFLSKHSSELEPSFFEKKTTSLAFSVSLPLRVSFSGESYRETTIMAPPRRSTRGSSSSGAAAKAAAASAHPASATATPLDVDREDDCNAFTPGRLSPSIYLKRKNATTATQLSK